MFENDVVNALFNIYLLPLGEFEWTGDFGERDAATNAILWIMFIFATFLLQITFMNMLIAIMGEVFNLVTERKHQSSLTERIELLNDFRVFLDKFSL